jgi:1-acyl-sn-glycerol-3-phosphate acyltransferase
MHFKVVRRVMGWLIRALILAVVRLSTGVRSHGTWGKPSDAQCVYFANHTSLGDFLLIWTVMPAGLRYQTRTVAALDYWGTSWLRRFVAQDVFNAVLISRAADTSQPAALDVMAQALRQGQSLIIFPEGTRNTSDQPITPFKNGLYHLAQDFPAASFTPIWLDNARHVMPKGAWLPVPMVCSVHVGSPLKLVASESSQAFLARAQDAVLNLRPSGEEAVTC